MISERDKYLTNLLDGCEHSIVYKEEFNGFEHEYWYECEFCGKESPFYYNFSTPDGFFKLWNWISNQSFYKEIVWQHPLKYDLFTLPCNLISPDNFANYIFNYLKDKDDRDN